MEIASNDGYLLQYFKQKNIPCFGIEPTANTAKFARKQGIATKVEFFNSRYAPKLRKQKGRPNLIIGNNVLAHDPDLNSFVRGLKMMLKNDGVITIEFPHLLRLISQNQFDTIYHEHYSYFSLFTVTKVFNAWGLDIYDVEELPTHGGSLRIYAKHSEDTTKTRTNNIDKILKKERKLNLHTMRGYKNFQLQADNVKYALLEFLIKQKKKGKTVAAYGAAAKGNTLLNYCGVKNDLLSFVVDKSPHKQGKFMPASHIPVVNEKYIKKIKPDYILILPWNIKKEIMSQLKYIREWKCKFVVPIPKLKIYE